MANNFFGLTDTGKVRGNNEDTFIAQTSQGTKYILAAAIDGVGGYSGGEIAAALAKETIIEYFGKSGGDISTMMVEALLNANDKIYQDKIEVKEHDSMACVLTLAVVDLKNNEFHYIHVGDTRLYLLRDGTLIKVTKDQSFVGYLEDSGRLTEQEAMIHPKRNEINKALGFTSGLENDPEYFQTGRSPFLPGDMILICSDGLTDLVNKQDITSILASGTNLDDIAQKLIDKANLEGGKDNITVVLVKNDQPNQQQIAIKPAPVSKKKDRITEETLPAPLISVNTLSTDIEARKTKSRPWFTLLIILCASLFLWVLYLLFFRPQPEARVEKILQTPDSIPTVSEKMFYKLMSSQKGDTLILHDSIFRQAILVSKTINLTRDTLYILSRGKIIFKPDSLFKGPVFSIPSGVKHVVLNGIVIDGFEVGIESKSKNLKLEGIQFLDCPVPVRYQFDNTPDRFMNGSLSDIFLRPDSLSQPIQR